MKKMSKHLIGIDAELYILYEEKVLFKPSENNVGNAFVPPPTTLLFINDRTQKRFNYYSFVSL